MSQTNEVVVQKIKKTTYSKRGLGQKLFLLLFFTVFCFSGALSLISIATGWFSFRTGITASAISIIILFLLGIKIDKIHFAFIALSIIIIISGLYNQSSLSQILNFFRNVIFSFLIYSVVKLSVTHENIKQVMLWCVRVAIIQLPFLLIQKSIYPYLPSAVHARIVATDIGSGSFDVNGDAAMTFFLVMMIIFLLFDTRRNYFIKHKWLISIWLTLTIFIAEAMLLKLIVVAVWFVFFLTKLRYKNVFGLFIIGLIIFGVIGAFGVLDEPVQALSRRITGSLDVSQTATDKFLQGDYARGAAINYYTSRGIRLLGDGPSRYYDVQSKSKQVGNNGHFLSFFSEVGLLGWLASMAIFFLIAFPIKHNKIRISFSMLLNFASLILITLTTFLMDNIALVFSFCVMSMTYLISTGKENLSEEIMTQSIVSLDISAGGME